MASAFFITFRETLEAALIINIVLLQLHGLSEQWRQRWLWAGVAAGIAMNLLLAVLFSTLLQFSGETQELMEGLFMLAAAFLLTWMLLWMLHTQRTMQSSIRKKVEHSVRNGRNAGIFFIAFFSVLREGAEMVLFLQAAALQASHAPSQLLGGSLGVALALGASALFFTGFAHLPVRRFLSISTLLLILFAAGLIASGIHELQEAHILPQLIAPVWSTEHLLSEKSTTGRLLAGIFGYNAAPSFPEVSAYVLYLMGMCLFYLRNRAYSANQ
ncbi:MAG: FTR1 family protein [Candidatus Peribacteraceae bacterium]|nr:FTR1 family protein [Candidatus Peribacteraceae bacterium]